MRVLADAVVLSGRFRVVIHPIVLVLLLLLTRVAVKRFERRHELLRLFLRVVERCVVGEQQFIAAVYTVY